MQLLDAPVTLTLLFANIAISLWAYSNPIYFEKFAEWPYQIVHNKAYYQMITSAFLHSGIAHLFFNMFALFTFGITLESFFNEMYGEYTGSIYYAIIYFGSLMCGSVLTVMLNYKNPQYVAVGASGAVSGIVFSYVIFSPTSTIYVLFFPMPAFVFAILWIAFSLYGMKTKLGNIGHEAHLGGAIGGAIITLLLIDIALPLLMEHINNIF